MCRGKPDCHSCRAWNFHLGLAIAFRSERGSGLQVDIFEDFDAQVRFRPVLKAILLHGLDDLGIESAIFAASLADLVMPGQDFRCQVFDTGIEGFIKPLKNLLAGHPYFPFSIPLCLRNSQSCFCRIFRPLNMRDLTVPTLIPSISEISW